LLQGVGVLKCDVWASERGSGKPLGGGLESLPEDAGRGSL